MKDEIIKILAKAIAPEKRGEVMAEIAALSEKSESEFNAIIGYVAEADLIEAGIESVSA